MLDLVPRALSPNQLDALNALASQVMAQLNLKKKNIEIAEAHKQLIDQQTLLIHCSKMSALGEMSVGLAHEINNPVAIILGKTYQLRKAIQSRRLPDVSLLEKIERIETTALRISKIVKGMSSFARNGTTDPLQTVSARNVIEETLEFSKDELRNADVSVDVRPLLDDVLVKCRPSLLSQVILNVLLNAKDACAGRQNRWIKVDFAQIKENFEIRIRDSGPGVEKSIQNRIFQPVFTTKGPGKGTGLGLHIAEQLMVNQGGSLTYDANDVHTCFVIRLKAIATTSAHPSVAS